MHDQLAKGLVALGDYAAMTPVEVLRTATSGAAEAIGVGGLCGTVREGMAADLIVVGGDPTADLEVLSEVQMVVAAGSVVPPMAAA
jgi:imidazolonepropionase-like amidohydrolase